MDTKNKEDKKETRGEGDIIKLMITRDIIRLLIKLIVIAVLIVIFFYPKPCDRIPFISEPDVKNCNCTCLGIKKIENNNLICYGMPVSYECKGAEKIYN